MPLHNPANVFPTPWRGTLTWAFGLIILFFCYVVWWLRLGTLREQFWWYLATSLFVSGILSEILKRWPKRTTPAPLPPNPSLGTQEGGWYFVGLILLMIGWWIASTITGGTLAPNTPFYFDKTLWVQITLGLAAIWRIWPPGSGTSITVLNLNRRKWVVSYVLFFAAMLMMIADTDFHHDLAEKKINWEQWIKWRILNYALILPYLGAGIAVVNGCSLKWLCSLGCAAVIALAIVLQLVGVKM